MQEETGLTAETLVDALQALVRPNAYQDLIRFAHHNPDQITMGPSVLPSKSAARLEARGERRRPDVP
jgi:hypothetical protein